MQEYKWTLNHKLAAKVAKVGMDGLKPEERVEVLAKTVYHGRSTEQLEWIASVTRSSMEAAGGDVKMMQALADRLAAINMALSL